MICRAVYRYPFSPISTLIVLIGLDTHHRPDSNYQSGLLHDLDWEKHPDEHPNYALEHILPGKGLSDAALNAIRAHAPERTGKYPESEIERYLFACDEISGFMHAVSLMRPEGFVGMTPKSVNKKLKDAKFAANVSRDDIRHGAELIDKDLNEHIEFLIGVFNIDIKSST